MHFSFNILPLITSIFFFFFLFLVGFRVAEKCLGHPSGFNANKALPMPPKKVEIFKSIEDWAKNTVLTLLKPIEICWQPQDSLPDPTPNGFIEQVNELG